MRGFAAIPKGSAVRAACGVLVALTAPLSGAAATITEFPVSAPPTGITVGSDGNLWFTEGGGSIIGRITPAGHLDEFPQTANGIGSDSDAAAGIVRGADARLWFADPEQNSIGRISTEGTGVQYPLAGTVTSPGDIALGRDGNYWFTESFANSIGRITPSGEITHFPVHGQPAGIVAAPDGNLWFTENLLSGCGIDFCTTSQAWIGVMTTGGNVKAEYAVNVYNPILGRIRLGPDGNLWYTQVILSGPEFATVGGRLGFVTPEGHVDSINLPTLNSGPGGVTIGPDGMLWFTEKSANQIGRRGSDGNFNEFLLPSPDSAPDDIVAGPDGSLWFTETKAHKIGRLTPGTPPPFTIGGYISGNWYNAQQPGQGFAIEVTKQQQMIAIWFVYTPDGTGQNWIYAQGPYDPTKSVVTLPAQILTGAKFPPLFRPEDVHQLGGATWGTLTFQFDSCDNGYVRWDSKVPGYDKANGVPLALTRLTAIAGTNCPGE